MIIYTIGHSTHSIDTFIHMLKVAQIELLADVRAFPASRKFPQFNQNELKESLSMHAIGYAYFPLLAGRRNKSQLIQEELNDGWQNQSFHNDADYSLTGDFQLGMKQLKKSAQQQTTAYCCSERHPSRCHRLLISNVLAANGWIVKHIIMQNNDVKIIDHLLGQWGAMPIIENDGTVVYPKLNDSSS